MYNDVKLEKGMYATSGGFTNALESLDPSENYKGTPLENLDAYERQLKRFDIKVNGRSSDAVEKFFQTSDSAALFPEYVSRAVRQGLEEPDALNEIIAAKTDINGLDYRSITSVPEKDDKELKIVAEGAFIPSTVIKTQENLVKLHKYGRMIVSSYEAIRFQRLNLFTVMLKQIGAYIAKSRLDDAVNVLISGDGNDNPAETVTAAGSEITYSDLVSFWGKFSPYTLNVIIASPDVAEKLLNLDEFKDSSAGFSFQSTGKLITPFGAKLIVSSAVPQGKLIGIDKNSALELIEAGGVLTEYDKLIDRQLERTAVTCISGFSKIFPEAGKVLTHGA